MPALTTTTRPWCSPTAHHRNAAKGPARPACHRRVRVACHASRTPAANTTSLAPPPPAGASRRQLLAASAAVLGSSLLLPARVNAFTPPPAGYRLHVDKLDGYYFLFPSGWSQVTTSGNDIFFRDPVKVDSNVFVDISSPSSSRFASVADLGTPEQAAKKLLNQYLNKEFMSTRLGIRREGKILESSERVAPDGRLYYNIHIQLASYASTNPYVVTQQEIMDSYGLEWQRDLVTVLGVANKRLYEFRLQADSQKYERELPEFQRIIDSFRVKEVV